MTVTSLESSLLELKTAIERATEVPVDQQRLVRGEDAEGFTKDLGRA